MVISISVSVMMSSMQPGRLLAINKALAPVVPIVELITERKNQWLDPQELQGRRIYRTITNQALQIAVSIPLFYSTFAIHDHKDTFSSDLYADLFRFEDCQRWLAGRPLVLAVDPPELVTRA